MNYFFPIAKDARQAEYIWKNMRLKLAHDGFPTEPRRIQALYFHRDFEPRIYQVGVEDAEQCEDVLLILRASNAPFYWVCTAHNGILEGAPIPVPAEGTRAVEFGPQPAEPKKQARSATRLRRRAGPGRPARRAG